MPPPRTRGGNISSRYGSDRDLSRQRGNNVKSTTIRHHQLDPSPQELPVKDTDQLSSLMDVASAPCKHNSFFRFDNYVAELETIYVFGFSLLVF